MAISIRNSRVEELARILAAERGESMTEAIQDALEARVAELKGLRRAERDFQVIRKSQERFFALPDLDTRSPEEILGYDESGLPG